MAKTQSNIEKLIAAFEEQQASFKKKMEEELKKTFVSFFKEVPQVTAIIWTQYSPYFNDGDECVFSVHAPTFTNCPVDQLDQLDDVEYGEYIGEDEDTIWTYGEDSYGDLQPPHEIRPALDALDRLIQNSTMSDILQALFGNHVKVTATVDGFEVENYRHD